MSLTKTGATKYCVGGTVQTIPAGGLETPALAPPSMGAAGTGHWGTGQCALASWETPLVAQIWGGFPRSQDEEAPRSFHMPISGWQHLLSDRGRGKRPVLLVWGKSPLRFLHCLSGRQAPVVIRSRGIQGGSIRAKTFLLFLPESAGWPAGSPSVTGW